MWKDTIKKEIFEKNPEEGSAITSPEDFREGMDLYNLTNDLISDLEQGHYRTKFDGEAAAVYDLEKLKEIFEKYGITFKGYPKSLTNYDGPTDID